MKKYIVNYIFVCLVILLVTSLLYIANNDIEEYVNSNNNLPVLENNYHNNLDVTVSEVEDNIINEADGVYKDYWNYIKTEYSEGVTKLNGCGSRFSSFMYDIKDKVDKDIEDSNLCKNFTYDDYIRLDLSDSGRNERMKATCLSEVLNNNQHGLKQLMSEYKPISTPLGRCGYLKDNSY